MNRPLRRSALRELQQLLSIPRIWLVFATVVFLFAVTGPFGTGQTMTLPARLGYWLIIQGFAWMLALSFVSAFDVLLSSRLAHTLPRMLVGAAMSALPIGLMLTFVNHGFGRTALSVDEFVDHTVTAAPIALALCIFGWLALEGAPAGETGGRLPQSEPVDAPAPTSAPSRPLILDRLPKEKSASLVRLEVQDHYVLVVTSRGRELVLMRMADAIRETAPAEGLQVHRSHWVARDAIVAVERTTGRNPKVSVRTTDGVLVPVSRANRRALSDYVQRDNPLLQGANEATRS